jgi:hypothetical protein
MVLANVEDLRAGPQLREGPVKAPIWYLLGASTGPVAIAVVRVVCLRMKPKFGERVVQQPREQGVPIEPTEILKIVV